PPTTVPPYLASTWYVVDDAAWEREAARLGRVTLAVYDWPGADRSTALGTAVSQAVPSESAALVANKHATFVMVRQTLGLSMFAGRCVSALFPTGGGTLLYSTRFTKLPED